jgi:thioredoxin 1
MSEPASIDDSSFAQRVLEAKQPVLVDFWATWCRPCQMVAPIVDELAKEFDGRVSFFKIDIDQNPKTPAKYNVMSIPTLLLFKQGKPVSHVVGFRPKAELKRMIEAALV